MKAGNEAARKRYRHDQSPPIRSRKTYERPVASNRPIGQKKSRKARKRPRRGGGRYSASIEGSTTSIPPRPSPARKRKVITDHGPGERGHGGEGRVPEDR